MHAVKVEHDFNVEFSRPSKELERLKVKLPGKPSMFVNPNWKDPEKNEVEAKVIRPGRERLEDVKRDPSKVIHFVHAFKNKQVLSLPSVDKITSRIC